MRNKKRNRIMLLLILLLGVTIGFAALATTLKINGTASVSKNTWNVYWANVANITGVEATTPTIGNDEDGGVNTQVNWSVTLDKPGDFYEFTVDAVNAGSIDAMVSIINTNVTSEGVNKTLPDYIKYTITYADGGKISENQLLAKKSGDTNTVETYKIRIEFLKNISIDELNAMPEEGISYDINVQIPYIQADDTAKERAITLCRKATKLHQEICDPIEDRSNNNYCTAANHNRGDIITFGNINTTNNLTAGDAYDCDVDNSGTWDDDERFYYLYNLDSDTAVMIFYNNVKQGEPNEVYTAAYDELGNAYANGPQTARNDLPTEEQWPNVSLKSKFVNIYDNRGNLKLANFSYEGYAARLISVKDLDTACNSNFGNYPDYMGYGDWGALDSCEFLMENTYYDEYYNYSDPNNTTNPGYWTDTPHYVNNEYYNNTGYTAMFVSTSGRMLGSPTVDMAYGIRPVIEIPVAELTK